jgi:putative oxidoreductase
MKIVKDLPFYLLGLVFVVFGLNWFLKFMPIPDMPDGIIKDYMNILGSTGYMNVVKICEVLFGLMLLIPKTRALGAILIAPVVVNILLFEMLVAKEAGIAIALLLINITAIYLNKDKYQAMLS